MENEELGMRYEMKIGINRRNRLLITLLVILCSLLICSCPLENSPEKLPPGFGSFSLSVDAPRTIFPNIPEVPNGFEGYTLVFTATSGGEDKTVDRTKLNLSESVILKVGTYSLTVSAYMGAGKTRLAARGTKTDIVIGPGATVSGTVALKTFSDGNGIFSYNVNITAPNVTSATMAITKGGTAIDTVTLNNAGSKSDNLTLASGVYNVRFTLIKGGNVNEEAVWNEILYIRAELTSDFDIIFDNDYFYRTYYDVTFVYNDEGATANTQQSVMHGGTFSNTPIRAGYDFAGWYTDAALTTAYTPPVYNDFALYAKWEEAIADPVVWIAVADSKFSTTNNILSIAYGNGKFVAGGTEGRMAYSTDNGVTWTAVANSPFGSATDGTSSIRSIAYGGGRFIAMGASMAAYSPDGIIWTALDQYPVSRHVVAYGDGKFVVGGATGTMAYSTDNGASWTSITNSIIYPGIIGSIAYGDGKFVAGGEKAGTMAYSTDGVTWNDMANSPFNTAPSNAHYIYGIAYGGGKFVAADNYDGRMAYSTDGITWNVAANSPFTSGIRGIAYGGGKFVAVGQDGKMAYSANGITWNVVANSTFGTTQISAIAYANGRFVAVGSNGKMAYSPPGPEDLISASYFYAQVAAYATATSNVTIAVPNDLTLDTMVTIPSNPNGATLTITSADPANPCTLYRGFSETTYNNGLFMLYYPSFSDGTKKIIFQDIIVDGDKDNYPNNGGPLVSIMSSSVTVTMESGAILRNNCSEGSDGYLRTGGVFIDNGTFTMNGGKIFGNIARSTGGVYLGSGTFTMNNGEISGNTSTDSVASGVSVGGTFTMTGGKISGNINSYAHGSGGGVSIVGGNFTMLGGEISGNNITGYNGQGGGVYQSAGTFRIVTGTIYGSTAGEGLANTASQGAALYITLASSPGSTAQHGRFSDPGNLWISSGTLTTTDTTVDVLDGELVP